MSDDHDIVQCAFIAQPSRATGMQEMARIRPAIAANQTRVKNCKQIKQFNRFATHRGKNIIVNRLENLAPGLYFIHVLGKNGLVTGKFIKN